MLDGKHQQKNWYKTKYHVKSISYNQMYIHYIFIYSLMMLQQYILVFKTILVPYDGSAMSDKALDKAVELANIIKESRIMIIHVVPEIPTPIFSKEIRSPKTGEVITFSEYMVSLYQEMESKMRERLEERKEKYSKYAFHIKYTI